MRMNASRRGGRREERVRAEDALNVAESRIASAEKCHNPPLEPLLEARMLG
jgi:hypothetical protein